jgi:lysine/ornithine N-monooxygenase
MEHTVTSSTPAVVIGAGPYGLSVAAHLRASGINARVFGEVMSSWRSHMPAGMCLKSTPDASSLGSPAPGFTLSDYCVSQGIRPLVGDQVVPIQLFTRYGQWFQERLVPDVEDETIRQLSRTDRGFHLVLGSGEELQTPRVVVATGITGLAYVPEELASVAPDGPSADGAVSHSSQHSSLSAFRGARVAVIGAGQSALESAALLHEAGAAATVLARGTARFGTAPKTPSNPLAARLPQPRSPLGPTWRIYPFSHAAPLFRYLPEERRLHLVKRVLGPLGAWWLADRVVGRIPILNEHAVLGVNQEAGGIVLTTACGDGQHATMQVDHVLAATGYRVDLSKLGFLGPELRQQIRLTGGFPQLSGSFESSVPGMYFVGLPAAATFGPLMRFVCGAQLAARRVSAAVGRAR